MIERIDIDGQLHRKACCVDQHEPSDGFAVAHCQSHASRPPGELPISVAHAMPRACIPGRSDVLYVFVSQVGTAWNHLVFGAHS
jgi:hypothetical protein